MNTLIYYKIYIMIQRNRIGDNMAEITTFPMPFSQAENYLSQLISQSGAFYNGSKPVIGRLKRSYGCGKVIGVQSLDNQVVTRIDYDPEKGYHFNFVDYRYNKKICILISDMTEDMYRNYVDRLTFGRHYSIKNIMFNSEFIEELFDDTEFEMYPFEVEEKGKSKSA